MLSQVKHFILSNCQLGNSHVNNYTEIQTDIAHLLTDVKPNITEFDFL